jgi:raffinose/stachyose/melibiose transport system substrate-binding protein
MKWNKGYLALILLLLGYLVSAGRVFYLKMGGIAGEEAGTENVIRVAHWQLEPGYREGLQWAIDRYNELPHVREAGLRVEQLAISERIYNQFMNVHLISGTAPDIAAKGMTRLIQGNNVAKFYAALGDYVNEPNPYNAFEFLSPDLDPDLREFLATAPWRNTFIDGMQGGFDHTVNDFNAVPVSTWGSVRMFYNRTLLRDGKQFLATAMAQDPQPDWLRSSWMREEDGRTRGFLPEDERLHRWLRDLDAPPETLGQLFLYCEAISALARERGRPTLVPISGSGYMQGDLSKAYEPLFTANLVDQVDVEPGTGASPLEAVVAWDRGRWNFETPAVREYYAFARAMSRYFPTGFLGLDREQAQRRFVLGDAAMIASGAWDASGIFAGATGRFEVAVTVPPVPAEGERWSEFIRYYRSEANLVTGVPLAVNMRSSHFEWALDFLKFATSQPINEAFNQRAAWLPSVIGAAPVEQMQPFAPVVEGSPQSFGFIFDYAPAVLRNQWTSQAKLLMTGDISYEQFVQRIETFLKNPQLGVRNLWMRQLQTNRDQSRAMDRTVSAESLKLHLMPETADVDRVTTLFLRSIQGDRGVSIRNWWNNETPDEPFPGTEHR